MIMAKFKNLGFTALFVTLVVSIESLFLPESKSKKHDEKLLDDILDVAKKSRKW